MDQPTTSQEVIGKIKDPKKQEAGRLGAAARKAKEKRILEELAASVKERTYRETEANIAPTTEAPQPSEPDKKQKLCTTDYVVAIGLAVILAGVLWIKPYTKVVSTPPPPPPQPVKEKPRCPFDME